MTCFSAAVCAVCIFFVDRPVARYVAGAVDPHVTLLRVCQAMAAPSLIALPFGLIYLCALVVKTIRAGGAWPGQALLTQASVAILAATAAKDLLKWAFGRPWPGTYLHFGAYAFHPFNNALLYGCFPSGHTSYIAAPLLVIAHELPAWRWLCYSVILMVMIGLVGANYHFPGDVIAGLLTGYLAAYGTLTLMRVPA